MQTILLVSVGYLLARFAYDIFVLPFLWRVLDFGPNGEMEVLRRQNAFLKKEIDIAREFTRAKHEGKIHE